MSIEYQVTCEERIPDLVRERLMKRADVTALEELESGRLAVRIRIREEHEKAKGSSFSFYIGEKEIIVSVHSAVWFAQTEAFYLIMHAFMNSGVSFRVEEL